MSDTPHVRPTRTLLAGAALAAAVAVPLAGCGGGSHPKVTLSGDLSLPNLSSDGQFSHSSLPEGSNTCSGANGYDDLAQGAQVTVADASGKIIGTGALGAGKVDIAEGASLPDFTCVWSFTVPGLPRSDFYKVGVTHRGTMTFTLAQVKAGTVHLSLGG